MNTIKNLRVNPLVHKVKRVFKLIRRAIVITILVTSLFLCSIFGIEKNKEHAIVDYYGKTSDETMLLDYIDLSEKLDGLDLGEYQVSDELYEKYNISSELMEPQEIEKLIEQESEINSFISSKNIKKQSENIDIVLNLKKQKTLVNYYIYYVGLKLANEDVTKASKEYAEEIFDVDSENISFKIVSGTSTTPDNLVITNTFTNENGTEQNNSYVLGELNFNSSLNEIREGVYNKIATNIEDEDNSYSASEYDKERNNAIINALKQSADMNTERLEEDLYNEKLSIKIK